MDTGTLSNTPAEAFSWNDLTLSDNGVFTLCPSLHLELEVAWTEGPEMLDFYRRCREVLGEALKWYTIGSGHLSKLSPRVNPMVTTWFERPVPFPKKMYTLIMRGTAEGITPASFEIDCRTRHHYHHHHHQTTYRPCNTSVPGGGAPSPCTPNTSGPTLRLPLPFPFPF